MRPTRTGRVRTARAVPPARPCPEIHGRRRPRDPLGGCLDVTGGATAAGSTLGYYACNGSPAQQFIPMADGSVLHPASNRCLDLPWADTTNGTRLQIYDCNGTLAQKWSVTTRG
ncbi:RICIN domain-containing protein [Streptomyces hydrogenans]|uniref:ricin-type beta-trefoil lectin domain protein n=1 Tax=Streptomyces hydrogenans TaxID=1873719 RepID=UPI00345DC4E9